jgi:hypothetical protein
MPIATSPTNLSVSDATAGWAALVKDAYGNPVPQIPQAQSNWCWAACAQMVLRFYGNDTVQQLDIASRFFGPESCADPGSDLCNSAAQVDYLALVYSQWGRKVAYTPDKVSFDILQSEINANRPVEIGFQGDDGNGHQVLVCGYNFDSTGPYLLVNDPLWGSGAVYYDNIVVAYGQGSWQWTWQMIL